MYKIIKMDYKDKKHQDFIKEMMYQAIYVPQDKPRPDRKIINDPKLIKYYINLGSNDGDLCFIAVDDNEGELAGAVWIRRFSKEQAGYGFVDEETPELSISIDYPYRGKGLGTGLIKHMLANTPSDINAISLSVDTDNYAFSLYQNLGFATVSIEDGTAVMIKEIHRQNP